MATSDILRLTLIANGAEAGTWGDTTNTNLGTILEDAIAGYAAIASSASQAFTIVDGAYDQARLAMIRLTTTTAANFAVYAPPVSKQYVIQNGSSYTATIYNSTVAGNTTAAGAGVAIPAGKTMTVWSNGTDFLVQNSHVIGTVVGNVTGDLTGNVTGNINGVVTATAGSTAVTQTFGDNDTSIATTAFVQAALQALHPVGSIYINATNSTNPGTLLGFGTWTAFGAGRVPVGFNAGNPLFDTAEETGGSADAITVAHTHTATSTDSGHTHTVVQEGGRNTSSSYQNGPNATFRGEVNTTLTTNTGTANITTTVASSGSSGTNANYQPYITVYMWKRTA